MLMVGSPAKKVVKALAKNGGGCQKRGSKQKDQLECRKRSSEEERSKRAHRWQWIAGKVTVPDSGWNCHWKRRKGRQKAEASCRNKCDDQKGPPGTVGRFGFRYSLNLALISCKMREKYRGMID